MLEQLRIEAGRKKLHRALFLLVIALVVAVWYSPGYLTLLRGPADLYSLDAGELEGRYVAARIDIIYDWYAESIRRGDETETPIHREYIIPAGSTSFMGVEIPAAQFDQAGAVLDSTRAVRGGASDTLDGSAVVVRGTIRQMDPQTLSFYHEVVGYDALTPEEQQRFLPLVLVTDNIGGYPASSLALSALALAAFALPSLGLALSAVFGKGPRQVVGYLGRLSPARYEVVADELDDFYDTAVPADRVRVSPRWLLYEHGEDSWLLAVSDVAWVYRQPSRSRGCAADIVVCSKSEPRRFAKHRIPVRTQRAVDNLLGRLSAMMPGAVFGYDPIWETLYALDPKRFCQDIRAALYAAGPGSAPLYDAVREAPDLFPPRPGDEPRPREGGSDASTADGEGSPVSAVAPSGTTADSVPVSEAGCDIPESAEPVCPKDRTDETAGTDETFET